MAFLLRHAAVLGGVAIGLAVLAGGVHALRVPAMGATVAEVSGRFGSPLPVSAAHRLIRMRDSTEADLRIELSPGPAAVLLQVLPDVEDAESYRATLSRKLPDGTREIATERDLKPDAEHLVSLFLASESLEPGIYLLSVAPEVGGQSATEFKIVVTR
jgi:hypothetical protein